MGNQPSPLESLASFGIAFVAGAISLAAVAAYGQWMRRRGIAVATTETMNKA